MLVEAMNDRDINAVDRSSSTALLRACEGGHVEAVKLLLERGATDKFPWRPRGQHYSGVQSCALVAASRAGNVELVSVKPYRSTGSCARLQAV